MIFCRKEVYNFLYVIRFFLVVLLLLYFRSVWGEFNKEDVAHVEKNVELDNRQDIFLEEKFVTKFRVLNRLTLESKVVQVEKGRSINIDNVISLKLKFCCKETLMNMRYVFWSLLEINHIYDSDKIDNSASKVDNSVDNSENFLWWFNSDNLSLIEYVHDIYEIFLIECS